MTAVAYNWYRMRDGFSYGKTTRSNWAHELWACDNLDSNSPDADTILGTCPIKRGTPYSDPNHPCVCKEVRVLNWPIGQQVPIADSLRGTGIGIGKVIVAADYDSSFRLNGITRTVTVYEPTNVEIECPQFQVIAGEYHGYSMLKFPRCLARRIVTKVVNGSADQLAFLIEKNRNKGYTIYQGSRFDGWGGGIDPIPQNIIPFVLEDYGLVDLGNGSVEVTYRFVCRGPVRGIPASPGLVEIPDLHNLDEWVPIWTTNPPSIKVRTLREAYEPGDPLP